MVQAESQVYYGATTGCLKFVAFQGVILHKSLVILYPLKDFNFRHLSSCGTMDIMCMWISVTEDFHT